MNIEFGVGFGKDSPESKNDQPLNVLIIGNFSGSDENAAGTAVRNMFKFDLFDIDAAMGRVGPRLVLDKDAAATELTFAELDQLHPDHLLRSFSAFRTINELNQALTDPSKAGAAVALGRELLGLGSSVDPAPRPAEAPSSDADEDMFSRLLGQPASKSEPGNPKARAAVQSLLKQVVADTPSTASGGADVADVRLGLDELRGSAMRELLHLPEFQGLEASWRGLQWFGEQLDVDNEVDTWLVDVGNSAATQWVSDVAARVIQSIGTVDAVVLCASFDESVASLADLNAVMEFAIRLRTRVFAAAARGLAGTTVDPGAVLTLDHTHFGAEPSSAFQELRNHPGARQVALGFPRILLRQPYGRNSDPIDGFPFEEVGRAPDHEAFLWGNPGFALALMSLSDSQQLDNLPMVVFDDGGGQSIKPPSEVYLTESAGDELLKRGLVPIVSNRGGTDIRVPRLQSVASTPTAI